MAGGKSPSYHGSLPNRALIDSRHTGTSLRLLGLYGFHDRLSLTRGAGAGCIASNKTLCARLGCDYTTLLKLRKNLEDWGYLTFEKSNGGNRRDVARVIPDHLADPETWPFEQRYIGPENKSAWEKSGELAINAVHNAGERASDQPQKAGETNSENSENPAISDPQYIPLRGEIYSSEEGGTHSSEEAHLTSTTERTSGVSSDVGESLKAGIKLKKSGAEAQAISGLGIKERLPKNWNVLEIGAQLGSLERVLKEIGDNLPYTPLSERKEFSDWLVSAQDAFLEESTIHQWAMRLWNHDWGELDEAA